MNIKTKAIVSNSDIIKNYKSCREKADDLGKIFIFKNNQPDAVLFSITEYEKLSVFIEYLQSLEEKEIEKFMEQFLEKDNNSNISIDISKNDTTL